jgi:2-polyprenyl-6-methoxyphenol hydroxylase-like FAD-dependent oxidoreductase
MSNATATETKVDVFVSGAGPVGLFFAYLMASRGHSVYCVDPKPGSTDQSRAILLSSRTMEIFEAKGFAAQVLTEAFVSSGIRMFRHGVMVSMKITKLIKKILQLLTKKSSFLLHIIKAGQIDASGDTSFPHMTLLMQGATERILNDGLEEETDCRVKWNTELVSYTQEDHYVTSIVRNIHTKEEQVIKSTYIVGADGSHSRVRKGNPDWTYEGVAIPTKFCLADLTLRGENIENLMDKTNLFVKGSSKSHVHNISVSVSTNECFL